MRLIITFDLDDMESRGIGKEIQLILSGLCLSGILSGMTKKDLAGFNLPLMDSRGRAVGLASAEKED